MISIPYELAHEDGNPINMVEYLIESKGWKFSRHDEEAISIVIPGQKASFDVSIEWQEEFSALLFACSIPLEIADANYDMAAKALEQINQNLWLGHFDLSDKKKFPTFRHTLLLRMIPAGIAVDIVADVFDVAVAECNRFYTTFQLAQAGDIRLHDDLNAAVFETIGEA
ncbi:MAG: YbjN domain-containing protein [Alphaproteobacteria bacterium]|nr:YbjN domain-containing protein [Alphaproteobacteria bacterium]